MAEKINFIKSSKKEIWDAYKSALDELDSKNASIIDPAAEQKKKEAERVSKSAEEVVSLDLVSPVLAQKYNDLKTEIANLESRLAELTEFETTYYNIVAIKNAYIKTNAELDEKAKANSAKRASDAEAQIKSIDAQIKAKNDEFDAVVKRNKEENKAYTDELNKSRSRETEEYKYHLDRSRAIENDQWNDEKAAREKILADKEAEITEKLNSVNESLNEVEALKAKVAEIPALLEKSYNDGVTKGEKDADKSYVFEKRAIENKAEYEKSLLNKEIELLKSTNSTLSAKVASLEEKLDAAYSRNQELATTVAQSSGVKVLTAESTMQNIKK